MRPKFVAGIILILTLLLNLNFSYAQEHGAKKKMPSFREEGVAIEKEKCEAESEVLRWRKAVHKKMKERTERLRDVIDGLIFKLNGLAQQAQEAKKEAIRDQLASVLIDYNSFYGDLGMMQKMLDLADFIREKNFGGYFDSMAGFYEDLKGSFKLKNDLFLKRIEELKDKEAQKYEKRLLNLFRDYFLYDIRQEKMDLGQDEVEKEDE